MKYYNCRQVNDYVNEANVIYVDQAMSVGARVSENHLASLIDNFEARDAFWEELSRWRDYCREEENSAGIQE